MALIGAILGDIAGSQFEFSRCRPKVGINYEKCELFTKRCVYTDDTICTLAVKDAIINHKNFAQSLKEFGRNYKYVGYGAFFQDWIFAEDDTPFNSFGNGTAMRISYIADYYDKLEDVQSMAEKSAVCTHSHSESIKGAVVTATCMWMAAHEFTKEQILEYSCQQYPKSEYEFSCEKSLEDIRGTYHFDASCQGSVPIAIRCFYESNDYESTLRKAFSIDCDMDTVCCMAGGIAENFYKKTGFDDYAILKRYLDQTLYDLVKR